MNCDSIKQPNAFNIIAQYQAILNITQYNITGIEQLTAHTVKLIIAPQIGT